MDSEHYTNITFRKPSRASSLENTDNDEKTIFDSTMMSIPDSLHDKSDNINDLSEQIKTLTKQLQSAHLEIENLNSENFRLKSDLQNMVKTVNTYKKICSTPERKSIAPGSSAKKCKILPNKTSNVQMTTRKENTLHSCSFSCPNTTINADKETQTCDTNNQATSKLATTQIKSTPFNKNITEHTRKMTSTATKRKQKNKLCVLSSQKSKGSLSIIEDIFSDYFDFCQYVFPNGTVKELVSDIENRLRNFNLNDYCILVIGENDLKDDKKYISTINMIKEAFQRVTHTNNIICCPTYITGAPIHNFRVEMFNNLIHLSIQNNKYAYLFDSNDGLSLDMFSYMTGKINNQGIRNIYERIMNNILVDIDTFNEFDINTINSTPDITTKSPQNEINTQFFL